MKPVHINIAESIFEPFWDPEISELNEWVANKMHAQRIMVEQTWCMASFKWFECSHGEPAFCLSREYNNLTIDENSDTMIVSAAMQKGMTINVEIFDGINKFDTEFFCSDGLKHEYKICLENAERVVGIKLTFGSKKSKNGSGWLNWIGVSNKKLLKDYIGLKNNFDEEMWEKQLKPVEYEPEFAATYGILLNNNEIEELRNKVNDTLSEDDETINIFMKQTFAENFYSPESHINDYVNLLQDTRYSRERDANNYLLKKGENAAIAGIIFKDKKLLRLAARYALSLAACDNWDDGFICDFKTSSFNHRCFVQSLCLYECAFILDIAGEMFTDAGRELVLRKIAEEGIGNVNYNTWKYEYIFHCNQMAWFSPGRMYGYAVLLENYPRVKKYMDIALDDVIENINNTIEDDGGYVEGPTYFSCIGRDALLALYIYARSRNVDFRELMPERLSKTSVFGEVIESTEEFMDFIPICDSGYKIKPSFNELYKIHLAFMAYFFPDSVWPDVYRKHIKNNGLGNNPLVWIFDGGISKKEIIRQPFIKMNTTGYVASLRKTEKGYAKIFIPGNKAGSGHTHCDKGSFVFEYNGEAFLMDPGVCSYDNPLSLELKSPERHNMLIPYGADEIPLPENPLMSDVIPIASGDEKHFRAEIDLTEGWKGWYKHWKRSIISPNVNEINVVDNYIIEKGKGVAMVLNSSLAVDIKSGRAVITGKSGRLIIDIPDECIAEVESLSHPDITHNRLMIYKEGVSGELRISMRMEETE